MVNHSDIYTALWTVFDNDSTLRTLLGRQSNTKVFKGIMPDTFGYPAVQVVIMTDNQIDTAHNLSDIYFLINVHSQVSPVGSGQLADSAAILARCEILIDDQSLTVSGHSIFSMFVEGHNPIVTNPQDNNHAIEGIRCRMFAAK